MNIGSGTPELITKSWKTGDRTFQGYVVLVNVPGIDTYEVGLSALRKCLGLRCLKPEHTRILSENIPDHIYFNIPSRCSLGNLQITEGSAAEWASRVKGLI